MRIRFTQSARQRRIGSAHVYHVMATTIGRVVPSETGDPRVEWVGLDDRGDELHIVAIVLPELLLVVHVMPARYRRRT